MSFADTPTPVRRALQMALPCTLAAIGAAVLADAARACAEPGIQPELLGRWCKASGASATSARA